MNDDVLSVATTNESTFVTAMLELLYFDEDHQQPRDGMVTKVGKFGINHNLRCGEGRS